MKYFLWLIALALLTSTSACSKKKESAPTDATPESKYGKIMKTAEDVTNQREKNSNELDEMMDE